MLLCLHAMARQPGLVIFCGYEICRSQLSFLQHLDDPDHLQKIVPPHRSVLHQHNKGRLSIHPFCNRPANLDDPDHLQEKHTHGPVPEQAVHFKSLERLILSTGT